jgi:cytoskeletal protein CcmA (bactofilin family)
MLDHSEVVPLPGDSLPQPREYKAPLLNGSATSGSRPSIGGSVEFGKGLVIRGEITGSDNLVITGRVEGSIRLDGGRVTVNRSGQAAADITARDVIVLGKVCGNVVATDSVNVRAEGAVIGDLLAPRIIIEDGAFIKGAIYIRKSVRRQGAN